MNCWPLYIIRPTIKIQAITGPNIGFLSKYRMKHWLTIYVQAIAI